MAGGEIMSMASRCGIVRVSTEPAIALVTHDVLFHPETADDVPPQAPTPIGRALRKHFRAMAGWHPGEPARWWPFSSTSAQCPFDPGSQADGSPPPVPRRVLPFRSPSPRMAGPNGHGKELDLATVARSRPTRPQANRDPDHASFPRARPEVRRLPGLRGPGPARHRPAVRITADLPARTLRVISARFGPPSCAPCGRPAMRPIRFSSRLGDRHGRILSSSRP